MTESRLTFCRLPVAAAATAALLALAGCSGTHVGDDWQCPLAQGTACTSIASADPAVVQPDAAPVPAIRAPLHGNRAAGEPERDGHDNAGARCGETCNPLSWLAGLFGTDDPEATETAPHEPVRNGSEPDGTRKIVTASRLVEPVAPPHGDAELRTGETIGRIWIAPFVDEGGVYREAGWVRVVIEPAGWRLP